MDEWVFAGEVDVQTGRTKEEPPRVMELFSILILICFE